MCWASMPRSGRGTLEHPAISGWCQHHLRLGNTGAFAGRPRASRHAPMLAAMPMQVVATSQAQVSHGVDDPQPAETLRRAS